MLPDGREERRLTHTVDPYENAPAGSPDGRWIAYARAAGGAAEHIWLMSRDGQNARQLTDGAGRNLHPTWSPDGAYVVFASDRDGNWEVYKLRLADDALTRLTFNSATDLDPDWSWASGRIAFQSNRVGPNSEIYSMLADGSDARRLTVNYNGDSQPSWSPLGDRIVFNGNRAEQTLYRMEADGTVVIPLVSRALRPSSPAWGEATGREFIAFTGYRPGSGHSEIMRVAPGGSGLVTLTHNEVNFDYSPGWLPAP